MDNHETDKCSDLNLLPPPPLPKRKAHQSPGPSAYTVMADAVGFVPNSRKRDNALQGIAVLIAVLFGAVLGCILIPRWDPQIPAWAGLAAGAVLGLVAGTFLGGYAVMIMGLIRTLLGNH